MTQTDLFKRFSRKNLANIVNTPFKFLPQAGAGIKRLSPLDELLLAKGGSSPQALEVYFDLFRLPVVYAAFDKQIADIIHRKLVVTPASQDPIDIECANFIRTVLEDLGLKTSDEYLGRGLVEQDMDFDLLTRTLSIAYVTGISSAEIVWGRDDQNRIIPDRIIPVDPCRILFVADESGRVLPKLLTNRNSLDGIFLPPRKFLIHRFFAVPTQDPYGAGIGKQIYWPAVWKQEAISSWLQIIDRHADPALIGKYPESFTDETKLDEFFTMIQKFGQDAALMMPDTFSLEKLDIAITGSTDLLDQFVEYCDSQILLTVLGESTTSLAFGGSQARETVQDSIRIKKAFMLSNSVTNCLRQTLVSWLTEMNFPKARVPKIHRDFRDITSEIEQLSDLDQLGVKMDLGAIADQFDVPKPPPRER